MLLVGRALLFEEPSAYTDSDPDAEDFE